MKIRPSGWRLCLFALVLVGLVVTCSAAVQAASGSPSVATESENETASNVTIVTTGTDDPETTRPALVTTAADTINVTYVVDRTPDDPDTVEVTYIATLPDGVLELETDFDRYLHDSFSVQSTDGMQYSEREEAWLIPSSDGRETTGRLTYTVSSNTTDQYGRYLGETVETDSWAFLGYDQLGAAHNYRWAYDPGGSPPDFEKHYEVAGEGYASDGYAFAGPVTLQRGSANGQTFTVVAPEAADPAVDTEDILTALTRSSKELQIGAYDRNVTAFVGPDPLRRGGRGGGTSFWVHERTQLDIGSSWFHEYVHTRQSFGLDSDMEWLIEASADYYGGYLGWQTGHGDIYDFRELVATDNHADAVLQDPDTVSSEAKNYYKGRRVMAALDVRIRNRTDGERTLAELFRRIDSRQGENTDYATFRSDLVALTDTATGDWLDRYVQTDAAPEIPPVDDIRSVYGNTAEHGLNVSVAPASVPSDERVDVTVTVTDSRTGEPVENATVTPFDSAGSRLTNESGVATLSMSTPRDDESVIEVTAEGYPRSLSTLPVYDPVQGPVDLASVAVRPETMSANTTRQVRLTLTADNVSNDGGSDRLTVDLPDALRLQRLADVTVTDAVGSPVALENRSVETDALTLDVSPGGGSNTSRLTVEAAVTLSAHNVTESTSVTLTAGVFDSDNGQDDATATMTLFPADANPVVAGSPARDLDDDGNAEDVNGDGTFNIVDVNAFFTNRQTRPVQQHGELFDFNGDGTVDIVDINRLFALSQQ
jgi:hypothetical protein